VKVWAIADLHLALGVPEKTMEVFGEKWKDYSKKLEASWWNSIYPEDLVLIAGDISWAKKLQEAKIDLDWIDKLPGVKVLIKGNHDYWWSSLSKVQKILPESLHLIQNNAFNYQNVTIGGSRLWDSEEYNFDAYIEAEVSKERGESAKAESEKIFKRELERLEMSLQALQQDAALRIAMTHYPPISATLSPSKVSMLLEKYAVDICVFGHLHNVKTDQPLFGKKNGVSYYLTSSDFLNFQPLMIYSSAK
jgi:uncharacterized protein